jgi:hypothetical protein
VRIIDAELAVTGADRLWTGTTLPVAGHSTCATCGQCGQRCELRIAQTVLVSTTNVSPAKAMLLMAHSADGLIPGAARVSHDNGNVAQVGGMLHGRFEANLDGHSGNQIGARHSRAARC